MMNINGLLDINFPTFCKFLSFLFQQEEHWNFII